MNENRPYVILNPASSGGKTGSQLELYREALSRHFGYDYSLYITTGPLDATRAARNAIRDGHGLIVSVGGDGTIQEVINGFFLGDELINPSASLGIIDGGTGSGFVQSLGLPATLKEQAEVLRFGRVRRLDLGSLEVSRGSNGKTHRFFCNECQIGIGAEVARLVQGKHKMLGGTLGFGLGAVQAIISHPDQAMDVRIDGIGNGTRRLIGIIVANGAYSAGGMHLAPGARQDDGELNVVLMAPMRIPSRFLAFSKFYSGKHIEFPSISYSAATSIAIDSDNEVLISSDGELLGTAPARIEVLPSVLPVMVQQ